MKRRKNIVLIIMILILLFILFKFYKSHINIYDDIMIFSLWENDGMAKEYIINPIKEQTVQIDIFQTIYNSNKIHKKIAPGSYGSFVIKLMRPINSNCKIEVIDTMSKPQNLVFELDGQEFETLKDMEQKLNEKFAVQNIITINWEWKYENNEEGDKEDTRDGENIKKYVFEIKAIVEN